MSHHKWSLEQLDARIRVITGSTPPLVSLFTDVYSALCCDNSLSELSSGSFSLYGDKSVYDTVTQMVNRGFFLVNTFQRLAL